MPTKLTVIDALRHTETNELSELPNYKIVVKAWRTTDETLFDDQKKATEYEDRYQAEKGIKAALIEALSPAPDDKDTFETCAVIAEDLANPHSDLYKKVFNVMRGLQS